MAVSRRTQKDVGNFEAKFIGPFTKNQAIFTGIAIVLSLFMKFLMDAIGAPTEVMVVGIAIVAAPCAILGFKKFNGMPAMDYFKLWLDARIFNPTKRLYKSETDLDRAMKKEETEKKLKEQKHEHKPSAEFPSYR